MTKFKTYQKTYPQLLAGRNPFQIKIAEEIGKRVRKERKQEQKLFTKIEEKKKFQNSEYFFNVIKTLN